MTLVDKELKKKLKLLHCIPVKRKRAGPVRTDGMLHLVKSVQHTCKFRGKHSLMWGEYHQ